MLTRRLTGLAGLHALRADWHALHKNASLYARYEWHLALATHLLDPASSIAYLQVLDGQRTVAIVPAIGGVAQVPLCGRLRVLSLGLHPHLGLADLPLAADVRIEDVAACVGAALAAWPESWDALMWPRVLGTSQAIRLARALRSPAAHIAASAPCNVVDTRRPYPELLAGLSKNLQISLRKAARRLADSGGARVTCNGAHSRALGATAQATSDDAPPATVDAAYQSFLALEASGWKGEAGTSSAICLNAGTQAFYAELLAQRSDDFQPAVTLLMRGEKPIAGQFAVSVGDCKELLKIGYDESESRFSPGQVLMAAVLEAACSGPGVRTSLVTDMPWHKPWRPQPEATFSVLAFRTWWRSALYDCYRSARGVAKLVLLGARSLWLRLSSRGSTDTGSTSLSEKP